MNDPKIVRMNGRIAANSKARLLSIRLRHMSEVCRAYYGCYNVTRVPAQGRRGSVGVILLYHSLTSKKANDKRTLVITPDCSNYVSASFGSSSSSSSVMHSGNSLFRPAILATAVSI